MCIVDRSANLLRLVGPITSIYSSSNIADYNHSIIGLQPMPNGGDRHRSMLECEHEIVISSPYVE